MSFRSGAFLSVWVAIIPPASGIQLSIKITSGIIAATFSAMLLQSVKVCTCQPCSVSCNFCYNYTICYQCKSSYYYFNTTILSCSPCSSHCVKCLNASYCTECETYYELGNNFCALPTIPTPNCDDNCNYCLISHQCLQCRLPYFLNESSHLCITCSSTVGLQL